MGTRLAPTLLSLVALLFAPAVGVAAKKAAVATYKQGVAAGNAGDLDKAMGLFARATRQDPKYAQAWRDLGRAFLYKKRYPEAAAALGRAAELNPKSYKVRVGLAKAYLGLDLPGRAIAPLRRAMKLAKKKESIEVEGLLATALLDAGKGEEAIGLFEKLVERNPSRKELLFKLARAQHAAKKNREAIATLDHIIKIDPGVKAAHLLKASIYLEMGEVSKAKESYGAACDLGDRGACLKSR